LTLGPIWAASGARAAEQRGQEHVLQVYSTRSGLVVRYDSAVLHRDRSATARQPGVPDIRTCCAATSPSASRGGCCHPVRLKAHPFRLVGCKCRLY